MKASYPVRNYLASSRSSWLPQPLVVRSFWRFTWHVRSRARAWPQAPKPLPAKVEDKSANLTEFSPGKTTGQPLAAKVKVGGSGYRTTVGEGSTQIPLVVVRGTPYEMGWHLGRLTSDQVRQFIPAAMARLKPTLGVTDQGLQDAWSRMAAYSDNRFKQEKSIGCPTPPGCL